MTAVGTEWTVTEPSLEVRDGLYRVSADIGGDPVWFESSDAALVPLPEAFTTLMFIPALEAEAVLDTDSELDAEWLVNSRAVPPLLHEWWGISPDYPLKYSRQAVTANERNSVRALCFTAGIDSMYALLQEMDDIDALMYVHGYDIDIDDTRRMNAFDASLRQVAKETGKIPVVVRTNLRKHKLFSRFLWERTHGAAIAAVGHLLAGTIGRLLLASSWAKSKDRPWGSHWNLDPLWSGSRVKIEHADATYSRWQKIGLLANEPLAQQHLRVCWENLTAAGNCSRCSKCLRTMVGLSIHGTLDNFSTFESGVDLADRIDRLTHLNEELKKAARDQLDDIGDPEVRAAMERLLERRKRKSAPSRAWRRFAKSVGLRR